MVTHMYSTCEWIIQDIRFGCVAVLGKEAPLFQRGALNGCQIYNLFVVSLYSKFLLRWPS